MRLAGKRVGAKRGRPRTPAIPRPESKALLAWYDRHRRVLPWRAPPGERADPYHVWLSEIMLQQTRVETVARYYERFLARFPTVADLAAAPLDSVLKVWAGLGYYARARNLHACARAVMERHGGRFPQSEQALRGLPGIGTYTAAAIAAIAFDRPAAAVDGNVERVVARLFAVEEKMPAAKPELRRLAAALVPDSRPGDFAQALMDLGATICTPRRPACAICPWRLACASANRGDPENFPAASPKQEGKLRRGAAFFVQRADGAVLLRQRPPNGLLGGMTEVPTTEWSAAFSGDDALMHAPNLSVEWRRVSGVVRHVFTHFPLELVVFAANVPRNARAPEGMQFVPCERLDGEALPTLMRKVIAHALRQGSESKHRDVNARAGIQARNLGTGD